MRRTFLLLPLVLAGLPAAAQPLPAEIQAFYEDWNSLVEATTLAERQEMWEAPGYAGPLADALRRIRERWVTPRPLMPVQGWRGFPVWSLRLEIRGSTWHGPEAITVSVYAWPTRMATPVQDPSIEMPDEPSARLGLTHNWRLIRGLWMVEQALEVWI